LKNPVQDRIPPAPVSTNNGGNYDAMLCSIIVLVIVVVLLLMYIGLNLKHNQRKSETLKIQLHEFYRENAPNDMNKVPKLAADAVKDFVGVKDAIRIKFGKVPRGWDGPAADGIYPIPAAEGIYPIEDVEAALSATSDQQTGSSKDKLTGPSWNV
jgi:hypothetical protein